MATDKTATVWTRATGTPRKLGLLMLAGDKVRFSYEDDAGDLPGISVAHDVPRVIGHPQEWTVTEKNPLPPMFQALIPPRTASQALPNLQRQLLLHVLEARNEARGGDIDWKMLLLAGRNGIGHLDVFQDDSTAQAFYERDPSVRIAPISFNDNPLWEHAYRAVSGMSEAVSLDKIIETAGIRPSVGGAMPKLLLPILPPNGVPPVEALVKIQGEHQYPGILHMEQAGYQVFERLGEAVPRRWFSEGADGKGPAVLATERFDRRGGLPVPMESLFSIMYVGTNGGLQDRWSVEGSKAPNFELVGDIVSNKAKFMADRSAAAKSFYRRIVANLLIGNSDMHLENFGFLGRHGSARLSPVYDPAPTAGYRSLRCVSVTAFGGMPTAKEGIAYDFGDKVVELAAAFGVQRRKALDVIDECLAVTADYEDLIRGTGVQSAIADDLMASVWGVRHRVEQTAREARPLHVVAGREIPEEATEAVLYARQMARIGPAWREEGVTPDAKRGMVRFYSPDDMAPTEFERRVEIMRRPEAYAAARDALIQRFAETNEKGFVAWEKTGRLPIEEPGRVRGRGLEFER